MRIISRRRGPIRKGHRRRSWRKRWAKVGHAGLLVSEDRVALNRRGAAITLNGIAQGYATDRVVERLRSAGLSTTLVNMGEIRAIGTRPEGTPWRVGLADPDRPGALTETVDLVDRAVATSAGAGFRFDPKGRFTHLFDPATGRSPSLYRTVSVIAPTATEADALSTAFSLMPVPRIRDIVAVRPNVQARILEAGGTLIVYGAKSVHLRTGNFAMTASPCVRCHPGRPACNSRLNGEDFARAGMRNFSGLLDP